MIVFVDTENEIVNIYSEKGLSSLDFADVDEISDALENKEVLYITNAVKTTSKDIVGLVRSLKPEKQSNIPANLGGDWGQQPERYFLHSTINGPMSIGEIDLNFNGPADCKEIDGDLKPILQGSLAVSKMLKTGELEIIGLKDVEKLIRKNNRDQVKKEALQSARDAALDAIIVQDDKPGSAADRAEAGLLGGGADDDMVIDLEKEL